MILTLVLTLVAFITLLPAYLSHRSMAKYRRAFQLRKWASFKDFEREFYKVQWERDIFNKHSFKPLDNYNRSMSNLSLESNYIEASIVIVNETQFIFNPIAYLKFSWFLFKNRTTEKNKHIIVNSSQDLRARKLKRLKNVP